MIKKLSAATLGALKGKRFRIGREANGILWVCDRKVVPSLLHTSNLLMDPNTEYERFTQEVYRQLSQATKVNAADVQHNVKLEGQSGQKHQIDVYWEYEKDGKTHRIAIECKNYSRRISLEKVCAFKGVLDDLDGVSGILVSKVGFQKGAKKYAQQYGISLKELRTPKHGETIIGKIENHSQIERLYTLFFIDENWAAKINLNLQRYREFYANFDFTKADLWRTATHLPLETNDNIIRDAQGNKISSLDELEKQIPDHPTDDFPYFFKFDDAYLDSRHFGPIKIREVKYTYEIKDETKTIALDAGDLVKAILKDAQSNETDFVSLE
ncbi:MAG: restriction endonuclease [Bacteroidales bacterium]|nr:restriction endonuclease [Bacteroidales bacterium]